MKKTALALAVMVFTACAMPKPGDIRLDKVYGVESAGTSLAQSRLRVSLGMANDSRAKVVLRQADLRLFNAQGEILQAQVDETVTLPGRSTSRVDVPLTLRFKGGLGAVTAIPRLMQDAENVRVSGLVRLRVGGVTKTHRVEGEPLGDLLRSIGIELDDILQINTL